MKSIATTLLSVAGAFAFASTFAFATAGSSSAHAQASATAGAEAAVLTDGEVRKIDREARKLTLKHADIKHLDMPAMTMVFRVQDAAMLDGLAVGDRVKFRVVKADGGLVVTELQRGK